jgi:hypothetical protein
MTDKINPRDGAPKAYKVADRGHGVNNEGFQNVLGSSIRKR